jgi:hypothetical protein
LVTSRLSVAVNRLAAKLRQSVACRPIARLTAIDQLEPRLMQGHPALHALGSSLVFCLDAAMRTGVLLFEPGLA